MLSDDFVKLMLVLILSINALCTIAYVVGYILGKTNSSQRVSEAPDSFLTHRKTNNSKGQKSTIEIDDSKFVGDIKTNNLEKKYESLGEVKHSSENIDNAVNKLKNIKS